MKPAGGKKAGAAAAAETAKKKPLRIGIVKLERAYPERAQKGLFGEAGHDGFLEFLGRLERAAKDNTLQAVWLDASEAGAALTYAQAQETATALTRLRRAGKKVYVQLADTGAPTYAALCGADFVTIEPLTMLSVLGVRLEVMHFKGLLDLLGMEADLLQKGEFKSAAEAFYLKEPSAPARKMYDALAGNLYEHLLTEIAAGRRLARKKVVRLLDEGPYGANDAVRLGLADAVVARMNLTPFLQKKLGRRLEWLPNYGKKQGRKMNFGNPFVLFAQLFGGGGQAAIGRHLAVLCATGAIMDGHREPAPFDSSAGGVYAFDFIKLIRKLAADEKVAAVILRVNSPGGSAVASEQIYKALKELREKKPLVVSMSSVAASGGYYISAAGEKIFAEPGTLTGSIGVFGGKIVFAETLKKLGLTDTAFSRGKQAGLFSNVEKFNPAGRRALRKQLDEVYDRFLEVVAAGRGKKRAEIDAVAHGRVWTGAQAKEKGLVDEFGGLQAAATWVRRKLGTTAAEKLPLKMYPVRRNFFELLAAGEVSAASWSPAAGKTAAVRAAMLGARLPREVRAATKTVLDLLSVRDHRLSFWAWSPPIVVAE